MFKTFCPNCDSRQVLAGESPDWCVICSHPQTGEVRGWVWKIEWLHKLLVSRHNFKRLLASSDNDGYRNQGKRDG